MALVKFIERFVVEKHRAIPFELRLVMHNQTWEGERPCHIRTVQTQLSHILAAVGYPWQLLVTLVS
jgi:hypothetical protein